MSTKRKRGPTKKTLNKKGKRKEDSDVDSDLTDGETGNSQPDEVLIASHGDSLDEPNPLPKELLNTIIKPAGQLIFFGNINFDTIGKREVKGQKILPNLYWPHRFTDFRVSFYDLDVYLRIYFYIIKLHNTVLLLVAKL